MLFRRAGSLLAGTVLCVILATGCTSSVESPAAIAERVRVSGSGTCLPLLRILTSAYPGTDVEFVYLPGLHSGGGIRGVANGDLEIGAVSRTLTDDERELGLEYLQLSSDGLAVAVHPSVQVDTLSTEELRSIYDGTHTSWTDFGGEDLPIIVLDRSEDESAKMVFREYVLGELEVADSAVNLFYESDMVSGLEGTPGAIGYFSLGLGISDSLDVSYIALDGVEPTVANVSNGSYSVVRSLGIVFAESLASPTSAFVEWMQGDDAISIMEDQGFARPRDADRLPSPSGE
ncbi:MAG: substrate-binding domain-containing protein [Actinomycetota bacterium]|nr:substrate-binding domain-containing protein [Actinomycetota bacterium]